METGGFAQDKAGRLGSEQKLKNTLRGFLKRVWETVGGGNKGFTATCLGKNNNRTPTSSRWKRNIHGCLFLLVGFLPP